MQQLVAECEPTSADVTDSHPSTAARIAALGTLEPFSPAEPMRLRSRADIDMWCLDALGFGADFRPVRLAELDLQALLEGADDPGAELADAAETAPGVAALTAAVASVTDGNWRAIAHSLEPDLRAEPDDVRKLAGPIVFSRGVARALAAPLRRAGWHRSNRWLATLLVAPDGSRVNVRDVVNQAVRTGDDRQLRALLAAATEGLTS